MDMKASLALTIIRTKCIQKIEIYEETMGLNVNKKGHQGRVIQDAISMLG
jgi:hypothetical protein